MQFQIISTESSKVEFLEKFVANNFASSDAECRRKKTLWPLFVDGVQLSQG